MRAIHLRFSKGILQPFSNSLLHGAKCNMADNLRVSNTLQFFLRAFN